MNATISHPAISGKHSLCLPTSNADTHTQPRPRSAASNQTEAAAMLASTMPISLLSHSLTHASPGTKPIAMVSGA